MSKFYTILVAVLLKLQHSLYNETYDHNTNTPIDLFCFIEDFILKYCSHLFY